MTMIAVRRVYDDLPTTIAMPEQLHHQHVEVILLSLETQEEARYRSGHHATSSLSRYAGAWQGEPLVREAQGNVELREELR